MRESGYYWVKLGEGYWEIGNYVKSSKKWYLCGLQYCIVDEALSRIDERKIERP